MPMREDDKATRGAFGQTEVHALFQRLGWAPTDVSGPQDIGLDLLIQVRDDRRWDAGTVLGAQVKTGVRYFSEPAYDPDSGDVIGWWYRETSEDHFETWANAVYPVLLVLYNDAERRAYWAHITARNVESTGSGAKILVLEARPLERSQIEELLQVAASGHAVASWEGTSFTKEGRLDLGKRGLRLALLTPRVVAPHPNAGYEAPLSPEAALALIVQSRTYECDRFASVQKAVPTLAEASTSASWLWRLVGAFAAFTATGEVSTIADLIDSAPNVAARVAAKVITASAMIEAEQHLQAKHLLNAEIADDKASPVDHAWLLVQLARTLLEQDCYDEAHEAAAAALTSVLFDPHDPSASAIRAAAVDLLFRTSTWWHPGSIRSHDRVEGRAEEIAAQGDSAADWWRAQTLVDGFAQAQQEYFERWGNDQAIRLLGAGTSHNQFYSAQLTAQLAGHHSAWLSSLKVMACHILLVRPEESSVVEAFTMLRRSTSSDALKLAMMHYRNVGPLNPLVEFAASVEPGTWTTAVTRSNLVIWHLAGDLLPEAAADDAARFCMHLVHSSEQDSGAMNQTAVIDYALRALSNILTACSSNLLAQAADDLPLLIRAGVPASTSPLILIADVLTQHGAATGQQCEAWLHAAAQAANDELVVDLTRMIGSSTTRQQMLDAAIVNGDLQAAMGLVSLDILNSHSAKDFIHLCEHHVLALVATINSGTYSYPDGSVVNTLVRCNLAFPKQARWESVLAALATPGLYSDYWDSACIAMATQHASIPDPIRTQLMNIVPRPPCPPSQDPFRQGVGHDGTDLVLAAALGVLSEREIADAMTRLLGGSWTQRRDAALLASVDADGSYDSVLLALLNDSDERVRVQAASCLAQRAKDQFDLNLPIIVAGLEYAANHPSVSVPLALAQAAAQWADTPVLSASIIERLRQHPSAKVRYVSQMLSL